MSTDIKKLKVMCNDVNLLYVEDDKTARLSTTKLLQNFFSDITIAVDGHDALEKYNTKKFDLIISDINMPKINGIEMVQKIREIDNEVSIVYISAYNESKYLFEAIDLGVDGFIVKPIVYSQFLKSLFKIIEKINLFKIGLHYKEQLELEVKKSNEDLIAKLHFDSLTNLLSRYSFFRDLSKLNSPVILLIDIDEFKVINEVYGTDVGSKLLKKFATYISLVLKDDTCYLYRLSADEFAIVDTTKYIDTEKYEMLIAELFEKLNNIKIKIDENIISVDITIGLSSVEENGYESAKIALDYAKKHRKPYVMYSNMIDHRKESSLTLKCRDNICSAIDGDRVVAVYQGIVNRDGEIVKYETLMRLKEEDSLKLIAPFYFLDVAIKTRLYEHLSSTVIFKALHFLSTSDKTVSVNFAYSDIKNTLLIEKIDTFFKEHKGISSRTVFEITESQSIENYDDVKSFIKHFRKYGVKIAIDDFGSGFSNFEYILEIEPDYLKIDGSLVKDIDTDSRAHTLVEAIVQFSHKLGIKVIAEFVHSEVIFEMLKELDVDEYQGFYFYEPVEVIENEK